MWFSELEKQMQAQDRENTEKQMQQAAKDMRTLYVGFLKAGFSKDEALYILTETIKATLSNK